MGYAEDLAVFTAYVKEKYNMQFSIIEKSLSTIDKEDPRIMTWAHAISEYFGIDINELFSKGRKNNSYEKIWMRYMIIKHENISYSALGRALGLKHSTIIHNINTCEGWCKVYPATKEGIMECATRHKLKKESALKIVYE